MDWGLCIADGLGVVRLIGKAMEYELRVPRLRCAPVGMTVECDGVAGAQGRWFDRVRGRESSSEC